MNKNQITIFFVFLLKRVKRRQNKNIKMKNLIFTYNILNHLF